MFLVAGLALTGLTFWALRGGLAGPRGLTLVGLDPQSLGMGVLAVALAAWFLGPVFGAAFVLAVMVHEFGHVAAYRVAGHADARFRLVPLMGGYAISDQLPASQAKAFFIALMGPGISVAPMVLCFALAQLVGGVWPFGANFLGILGTVIGALNLLNLLPFWPLDGGRCLRMIVHAFTPRLAQPITIAMSAAFAAAALAMHSLLLFAVALLGAQSIAHAEVVGQMQRPMTHRQALIGLGAYVFTAAAHLTAGGWLIARFL